MAGNKTQRKEPWGMGRWMGLDRTSPKGKWDFIPRDKGRPPIWGAGMKRHHSHFQSSISGQSLEKLSCKCHNFSVTVWNSCFTLHGKVNLPCCKQRAQGSSGRSVELIETKLVITASSANTEPQMKGVVSHLSPLPCHEKDFPSAQPQQNMDVGLSAPETSSRVIAPMLGFGIFGILLIRALPMPTAAHESCGGVTQPSAKSALSLCPWRIWWSKKGFESSAPATESPAQGL